MILLQLFLLASVMWITVMVGMLIAIGLLHILPLWDNQVAFKKNNISVKEKAKW